MKRFKKTMLMPWAGGSVPPSSLLTSLISYWTLDELSGTRADSVVASGNDLTDNNTVTNNPGIISIAAQFTSANSESLSRADNTSLSITGDMTLDGWVYLDSKAAQMVVAGKANLNGASTIEYMLWYNNGTDRFNFTVSNGTTFHTAVANTLGVPALSTWYYLCGTHINGASVNISVNNGATDTVAHTIGIQDSTQSFRIGSDAIPSRFMNGRVDEVGLWRRVLTAAEITARYNAGAGRTYPFLGT